MIQNCNDNSWGATYIWYECSIIFFICFDPPFRGWLHSTALLDVAWKGRQYEPPNLTYHHLHGGPLLWLVGYDQLCEELTICTVQCCTPFLRRLYNKQSNQWQLRLSQARPRWEQARTPTFAVVGSDNAFRVWPASPSGMPSLCGPPFLPVKKDERNFFYYIHFNNIKRISFYYELLFR